MPWHFPSCHSVFLCAMAFSFVPQHFICAVAFSFVPWHFLCVAAFSFVPRHFPSTHIKIKFKNKQRAALVVAFLRWQHRASSGIEGLAASPALQPRVEGGKTINLCIGGGAAGGNAMRPAALSTYTLPHSNAVQSLWSFVPSPPKKKKKQSTSTSTLFAIQRHRL